MTIALDYTSRDFDGLKSSLLTYASTAFPEWVPSSEGDFGMLLLELLAYVGDVNSYYVDRAQQEAYITTATQRSSVLQIARLLGYTPGNGAPAQGTVYVVPTLASGGANTVNIPPGTQFVTGYLPALDGQIVYEYLGESSIPVAVPQAGQSPVAVGIPITEGRTIVDLTTGLPAQIGIATALPGQAYQLPNSGVYLDSVKVYVAGVPFAVVPRFTDWGPADDVCVLVTDEQGFTWVTFGDGLTGSIPGNGLTVTASYRIGFGASGNVAAGSVTSLYSATPAGISVQTSTTDPTMSTSTAMVGGADPESIEQIRFNAPASFAIQNRIVTVNDFNSAAVAIPGVAQANTVSSFYTSVNVFILGADGSGVLSPILPPPGALTATTESPRTNLATDPRAKSWVAVNTDLGFSNAYALGTYALGVGGPGLGDFTGPNSAATKTITSVSSGSNSFLLTTGNPDVGSVSGATQSFPIAASTQYTLSLWAYTSTSGTTPVLEWSTYTNTGASATSSVGVHSNELGSSGVLTPNTWTRLSFTFTTGSNSAQFNAYFNTSGTTPAINDIISLSGLLMEVGSATGYYFDGTCNGCVWNGMTDDSSSVAGILPAGSYYYVVTALNGNGETLRSVEASVSSGHYATLLSWSAVPGAIRYKVYRGTTAGNENVVYSTQADLPITGTSYMDIGAPAAAATPPVSATATVSGGATSGIVTKVQAALQEQALAGVSVQVAGALPVTIDLGLTSSDWPVVEIFSNYSQTAIAQAISTAVNSLFTLANISIGQRVSLSLIYNTIMSVPGVQWCQIPGLYRDDASHSGAADIQLQPWEYPVLNPNFSANTITINGGF